MIYISEKKKTYNFAEKLIYFTFVQVSYSILLRTYFIGLETLYINEL